MLKSYLAFMFLKKVVSMYLYEKIKRKSIIVIKAYLHCIAALIIEYLVST